MRRFAFTAEERAALTGDLIHSLDRDVDIDAEAAWSAEIRSRLDRVDDGLANASPGLKHVAASTRPPAVTRKVEYLEEAVQEAEAAAKWYAERSITASVVLALRSMPLRRPAR